MWLFLNLTKTNIRLIFGCVASLILPDCQMKYEKADINTGQESVIDNRVDASKNINHWQDGMAQHMKS